jgi:hypothetical protein
MKPRNDRALALSAFCLQLEKHRRTPDGRVRTADAFLQFYFPRTRDGSATDRLFHYLPPEVRGPILAGWGIRGRKAALRDDDERVKYVVLDALEATDVDATMFEEGVAADVLIDHAPLADWWQFWRGAALPNNAVQRALATARALHLVDDRWFLENIEGRSGKLKGTDAVCDTLTKDEISGWIREIHASGDASPAGLVAARGWENVLKKTAPDALLAALDAFARKVHLVPAKAETAAKVDTTAAKVDTTAANSAKVNTTAAKDTTTAKVDTAAKDTPAAKDTTAAKADPPLPIDGFDGMPPVESGSWLDEPSPTSPPPDVAASDVVVDEQEVESIRTGPPPLPPLTLDLKEP